MFFGHRWFSRFRGLEVLTLQTKTRKSYSVKDCNIAFWKLVFKFKFCYSCLNILNAYCYTIFLASFSFDAIFHRTITEIKWRFIRKRKCTRMTSSGLIPCSLEKPIGSLLAEIWAFLTVFQINLYYCERRKGSVVLFRNARPCRPLVSTVVPRRSVCLT